SVFKGPVEDYFQIGRRVELRFENGAPTLAEYPAVEILPRHGIDGSRREVILADGIARPFHAQFADFIISVDRLLVIVPLITVKHTAVQYGWYAPAVVTSTPSFDFVLSATERDHDAPIIHKRHPTRWRIPVGILPIESGPPRIAHGTERGEPLFIGKSIEHGLPLVHLVRAGAGIQFAEVALLLIVLQL